MGPIGPNGPIGPWGPYNPTGPWGPVSPFGPATGYVYGPAVEAGDDESDDPCDKGFCVLVGALVY